MTTFRMMLLALTLAFFVCSQPPPFRFVPVHRNVTYYSAVDDWAAIMAATMNTKLRDLNILPV